MPTGMGSYAGTSSTHSGSVQAPGIVLSVPSLEVNEGGQATYTVSLETQPSGNVSVAIAGADLSPDPQTLNFTSTTWSTVQIVTLSPGTDRNATDQAMYLTHGSRAGSVDLRGPRRPARCARDGRPPGSQGESETAASLWSGRILATSPGSSARTCRADAAPHDGRRPGRGQEGAGCQRRFPVITARSMECSSEPGVIVAGAGALPRARRRCEAGKRTHGPGPRACLALLAATALLALAAPAQAQTEVPADWALKPADIGAGEQFRLMFVSSTTRDATSTDIADYNTFVSTRAAAGVTAMQTYADDFTALVSTESVNARTNTLTRATDTDAPIYRARSGTVSANDRVRR